MNALLKTIYCGYQHILLVGRNHSDVAHFSEYANVDECQIKSIRPDDLPNHLVKSPTADLLVIDVDSIGAENAAYLHFMAICFQPEIPVIIMTTVLNPAEQQRFLASGVLEILNGAGTSRVLPAAA